MDPIILVELTNEEIDGLIELIKNEQSRNKNYSATLDGCLLKLLETGK